MPLIDDFKDRFPEFEASEVDARFPPLEDVWPYYYGRPYGGNKEVVLNLLAHLFVSEISSSSGAQRAVESKSVGNVSVSYSASTQSGGPDYDFFRSTKYGQRFLVLIRPKRGGVFV